MKRISLNGIGFAVVLSVLALGSCSKVQDGPAQAVVEKTMSSGEWKITLFDDSGKDETYHFNGFRFTFEASGELVASNGSVTYQGTWSISDSNSNDDSYDDLDFNIYFNLSNEFEELTDDWDIISNSDTKIELIDISGGNGGTDYLTFEQN